MLDNKLNVYGGFTPVASAPPKMRYHLIRYCVIISISEGAVWGDRHCPLQHLTSALNYISKIMKKYQSLF